MRLENKHILLGITGSIAAYKSYELLRLLQKEGATVQVMVTPSALQFVTKVTLEVLSGFPVLDDLFAGGQAISHIDAVRKADVLLVAPVTAQSLAKFSWGMAGDIVSASVLAAQCPVLFAPAMNTVMWKNFLVQENIRRLQKAGYLLIPPTSGVLACGEHGEGKFPDVRLLVHEVVRAVTPQDFLGKNILVSGGATREYVDPVRFFSNASSGRMARSLVLEAYSRGAKVTFVTGHGEALEEELPTDIRHFHAGNVADMYKVMTREISDADVFISAAAVSDIVPRKYSSEKIEKKSLVSALSFKSAPDILSLVSGKKKKTLLVGFALQTERSSIRAREKFHSKNLDLLIMNSPDALGNDHSEVSFLSRDGVVDYPLMPKSDVAKNIFDFLSRFSQK